VNEPKLVVENRGLPIAVHELGAPEGRPVLALHGFLDHGLSFRRVADHANGVTLFAPDARGHGHSGWVGAGGYYHFYDYLDDLRRVLDVLPPRLGLVGHSMGGTLALALAGLFPERFDWVLLLEGMGPPSHDPQSSPERLRGWLRALVPDRQGAEADRRRARTRMESPDEAGRRLLRLNPRLDADHARALGETFSEPHPDGGWTWRFDPLHRTPSPKPFRLDEVFPLWRRITAPVVSLWGEHGFHPEELDERHRVLGSVDIGLIERAGHNLHHERPELIGEIIRRLAESHPSEATWAELMPLEIRPASLPGSTHRRDGEGPGG